MSGLTNASVLATLANALTAGSDVILSSYTNATDGNGFITLVAYHAPPPAEMRAIPKDLALNGGNEQK